MSRETTRALRTVLELLISITIIALFSYAVARTALGNPFVRLGEEEQLSTLVEKQLSQIYGLDKSPLSGSLSFLRELLHGNTGQSIIYNTPAFQLAAYSTLWTLAAVVTGFTLALLFSIAWFIFIGPESRVTSLYRKLSFIPGYIYAIPVILSTWLTGWPTPLPSASPDKITAYAAIVFIAASTRLLHGLIGMTEDSSRELDDYKRALQAIGAPDRHINRRVLRVILPTYTGYSTTLLGTILERSVIIEPLIGYTGAGMILYNSVLNTDPILAATTFTIIGSIGYLTVALGRALEPALDPRLRE